MCILMMVGAKRLQDSGGRVFLFLRTDDFWRDYNDMLSAGISLKPTRLGMILAAINIKTKLKSALSFSHV